MRSSSSPADETIVRTVRELAHRLGLVAVAEGVESQELFDKMVAFDFDILQGFHLAKPLTEHDLVVALLDQQTAVLADRVTASRHADDGRTAVTVAPILDPV